MEIPNIKRKVVSGIVWSTIQLVISKLFAFIIKLILARLLFPDQFGLVGMAVTFTSFVQVFNDLGIGAALVQRKDEKLREEHFHTAFWTGVVWAIAVYLVIYFAVAPLAAAFYEEPLLESIIPILSIGVLSSPVNLIHRAQLTRQMDFKKIAYINNFSTIFAGVLALVLAFMGAGVWSLVFNSTASFIVAMPLYFKATRWLPKFTWEERAFKDVFGFGLYTTATQFFNVLMENIDYLLIGKLLSASALGIYTLAFVLTDFFRSKLTTMISKVMYPVYGQKQDDPKVVKRFYLKIVKFNSIYMYPIMIFFIVLGEPFVVNFFGAKWIDAVPPLRILAFSVMFHMLVNSHAVLIRGLGHTKLEMKMQFVKALLYVPTISLGIYWYGTIGAAWAYVINKVLEVMIAQYYLKKLVGVTLADLMLAMKPTLCASVVSSFACVLLYYFGLHYMICALGLGVSYGAVIWMMMRAELGIQLKDLKNFNKMKAVAP